MNPLNAGTLSIELVQRVWKSVLLVLNSGILLYDSVLYP